jgi:hypothetical protein
MDEADVSEYSRWHSRLCSSRAIEPQWVEVAIQYRPVDCRAKVRMPHCFSHAAMSFNSALGYPKVLYCWLSRAGRASWCRQDQDAPHSKLPPPSNNRQYGSHACGRAGMPNEQTALTAEPRCGLDCNVEEGSRSFRLAKPPRKGGPLLVGVYRAVRNSHFSVCHCYVGNSIV